MLVIGRSYGFSIQVDEAIGAMTKLAEETTEKSDETTEVVTALTGEVTGITGEAVTVMGLTGNSEIAETKLIAYRGGNSAGTKTDAFCTGLWILATSPYRTAQLGGGVRTVALWEALQDMINANGRPPAVNFRHDNRIESKIREKEVERKPKYGRVRPYRKQTNKKEDSHKIEIL